MKTGITLEKINVLKAWKENPLKELSRAEIMQKLGKKTKTWTFNSLKELAGNKIIISKRKGNSDIYSLALENPLCFQLLGTLEAIDNINFLRLDIISEIVGKVSEKDYCLIVFGSYAEGKNTKNSDIDICFLIKDKETEKKIKPYVNEIKLNYSIKIDEHYILFEEFEKMLLREEENLGKQIFKKHKIFYNSDIYYQLIKETYKHGFR
jgi:predicted nucleotidyltransferase